MSALRTLFLPAYLLTLRCADPAAKPPPASDASTSDASADASADISPMRPPPPELDPPPLGNTFSCDGTLESIRDNIFRKTCQADTCHSLNGAAFGLRLVGEIDAVYDELVGARTACNDELLVAPGDPSASYLIEKIQSDDPACGNRMPWGYQPLPQEAVDCIVSWIDSL